jgi:tRNA threonylcarbamoyl adenosine modification protein YjeE
MTVATTTLLELETGSAAETEAAAERLARRLHPGDLLRLIGELGSGKTTFVRGLARGLGSPADVMSPTFQLVRVYAGTIQLAHVDLYRLASPAEIDELGLDELLEQGVVAVEWGDRLPARGMDGGRLTFEVARPGGRRLRLEGGGPDWSW